MKKNPRFTGWPTGLCIALAVMLLGGCDKIQPGVFTAVEKASFSPTRTAVAEVRETDQVYEAVGTVRPKTETRIEARVTGQVLDVRVSPGDPVAKGQLLVSLDSRQMTSRLDQARQALKTAEAGREQARHLLEGARAGFKQARANYDRVKRYFESQAATAQDLEGAESTFRQAEAGVKRAQEALAAARAGILQARAVVKESTISIEYTRILAPRGRGGPQTLCGARRPGPARQAPDGPAHLRGHAAGGLCPRRIDHPGGTGHVPGCRYRNPGPAGCGYRGGDGPLCGPQLTDVSGEGLHAPGRRPSTPACSASCTSPLAGSGSSPCHGPPSGAWASWNWFT